MSDIEGILRDAEEIAKKSQNRDVHRLAVLLARTIERLEVTERIAQDAWRAAKRRPVTNEVNKAPDESS